MTPITFHQCRQRGWHQQRKWHPLLLSSFHPEPIQDILMVKAFSSSQDVANARCRVNDFVVQDPLPRLIQGGKRGQVSRCHPNRVDVKCQTMSALESEDNLQCHLFHHCQERAASLRSYYIIRKSSFHSYS